MFTSEPEFGILSTAFCKSRYTISTDNSVNTLSFFPKQKIRLLFVKHYLALMGVLIEVDEKVRHNGVDVISNIWNSVEFPVTNLWY